MKQIFFVLAVLVIVSCDKKDDPNPADQILGSWFIGSTELEMSVDGQPYDQYLVDHGLTLEEAVIKIQELKQLMPSSGFYSSMEFTTDGRWNGQSAGTASTTGTWTLSSDAEKLSLTNDAQADLKPLARVTKLTEGDLWLITTPTVGLSDDVVPQNFTYTAIIKYVRKQSQ